MIPILYARSDVCSIAVPVTAGGCGATHIREVTQGAPAKIFSIDCGPCEEYLRKTGDKLWATTLSEVPETYDETLTREDFEKRGTFDRDAVMAMAMAKLAGVELPETLRRPLTGLPSHVPTIAGQIECEAGHPNEPGMKFCGECGVTLRAPSKRTCPDGHEVAAKMRFCGECGKPVEASARALEPAPEPPAAVPDRKVRLKDRRAEELRQIARNKGLDDSGTRADLLARLQAA